MKNLIRLIVLLSAITGFAQNTIPVTISKNGHIMVKAQINGVEGNFIFDTGAGLHVISNKFYQKIKSHVSDSSWFTGFRHTGERLDAPVYQFGNLTMGQLNQQGPWIGVFALFDEMGFDGLISCKLIENNIITMDVRSKQLIIETEESIAKKRKHSIPMIVHSDRDRLLDFFIHVKINNSFDALLEFDTGSGYSPLYLHTRYMQYAAVDSTRLEIRDRETGFGKTEKTYFDKTKDVRIHVPGTEEGGNPNIVYKPSLIYDGLTSYIIFGDKSWTIDIPNKNLHLLE